MPDDPSSSQEAEDPGSGDATGTGGSAPDEDADGTAEDDRKPISVRDLMPPPASRSRRAPERREPPPVPARQPGEEEDEASGEEEDEEAGASRPTPVRVAMDAPPPGDSRPAEALPARSFEAAGQEWVVRITGRTVTGTRPDPGALLMHLTFFRAEAPKDPVRELLTVHRPLEALYPEDLEEFLERSRPARRPPDEEPDAG